jgi:hypothetical protein
MGPGLSHKTVILDLYFKNYTFTEIERITNHSETSIKRYLSDFIQIATMYRQKFSENQIRTITKMSNRIIREYVQLYQTYEKKDNQRLWQLLTPQEPNTDAKKKANLQKTKGDSSHE